MGKRLQNISLETRTIKIVRPNQTVVRSVDPTRFINLTDEEYTLYMDPPPPLNPAVWTVTDTGTDPIPEPQPLPGVTTTDDLPEGLLNKYFLDSRARTAAVDNSINSLITDKAPSQAVLFTALATKVETGANVGTGAGNVFKQKTTTQLQFRKIKAGSNVTVTQTGDDIEIASTGGGGGGGDIDNGANLGSSGAGIAEIFAQKNVDTLEFKRITQGSNVTVSQNSTTVTIAAASQVVDAINDGVTATAPSQNAVFDALAGKANTAGGNVFSGVQNIAFNGSGEALSVTHTGVAGSALLIDADVGVGNNSPAIYVSHGNNSTGDALVLDKFNTGGAVTITQYGDGPGLDLLMLGMNSSGGINVNHAGGGSAFTAQNTGPGAVFSYLGGTSGQIDFKVPGTITSYSLTYPDAQGQAGQVLSNDGNGTLSWTAASSLWVNDDPNMFFTSGNVGIGIVATGNRLAVSNAGASPGSESTYQLAIYPANSRDLTLGADADGSYVQSWSNKPLIVNGSGNDTYINGTSFGRVAIGHTAPSAKLDLRTTNEDALNVEQLGNHYALNATTQSASNNFAALNVEHKGATLGSAIRAKSANDVIIKAFGSGSGIMDIKVPVTITDYSITFPAAQGFPGQIFVNDGSGNLSWSALSLQNVWDNGSGVTSPSPLQLNTTTGTGQAIIATSSSASIPTVELRNETSGGDAIKIYAAGTGSLGFTVPDTVNSYSLRFPNGVAGSPDAFLFSQNGDGVLQWANILSTQIFDFDDAVKLAAVGDAIIDGIFDVAPSQNAVFDALGDKRDRLLSTTTTLNAAAIHNLHNYPGTQLVTVPFGKILVVQYIELFYDFGTTAFTLAPTTNLVLNYSGNYAGGQQIPAGTAFPQELLNATNDIRRVVINAANNQNLGIQNDLLLMADAAITGGDSVLKVRVFYDLIDALT